MPQVIGRNLEASIARQTRHEGVSHAETISVVLVHIVEAVRRLQGTDDPILRHRVDRVSEVAAFSAYDYPSTLQVPAQLCGRQPVRIHYCKALGGEKGLDVRAIGQDPRILGSDG